MSFSVLPGQRILTSILIVLTLNLTQSENFAAPPYNFSPTIIGFFNFAILIGGVLGLVTAGPLSDWISMQLTRRNRGIREPEMRLLTMIPYVIIMIIGNFVVAYGYEKKFDWKVSFSPSSQSQSLHHSICGLVEPYFQLNTERPFRLSSLSVTQPQASRLLHYPQSRPPMRSIPTNLSRARYSSASRSTRIFGVTDSRSSLRLGSEKSATFHRS